MPALQQVTKSNMSTFGEVAQLIAPNTTPDWLVELLCYYGLQIAKDRELQERLPSKATFRRDLFEARKAVDQITNLLNDDLKMLFVQGESGIHVNIPRLTTDLAALASAANRAAASPVVSGPNDKTKAGRGRSLPRKNISPKTFCALVVVEAWLFVRGHLPTIRNREAGAAAQTLWLACGGIAKGWGSDPGAGWSYYFRDARTPATRSLRTELRHQCAEFKRKFRSTP